MVTYGSLDGFKSEDVREDARSARVAPNFKIDWFNHHILLKREHLPISLISSHSLDIFKLI